MADFEISVWKDIYDSEYKEDRKTITVPELFNIVRGKEYKHIIERIRAEPDKQKRTILKESLPAITISGTFRERKNAGLVKHSGFICIDFDAIGNKKESVRELLKADKFVYGLFWSASGNGLAVIVRIDGHLHNESFISLEKYFYENYGLVADIGCKEVSRLRYISHDEDAHINTAAEIYNKFPKVDKKPKKHYIEVPCTHSDIGKIVAQATQKQMDVTDGSYAEWQRLVASLVTQGESCRDYIHALSQYHPKYDYNQCNKKIDNLLNTANGNITIGTFYYFAKRAGLDINSRKPSEIIKTCRDVKRRKDGNVDIAIEKLKEKEIICNDEDAVSQAEDIVLVKDLYEKVDIDSSGGIVEVKNYIIENYDILHNEITDENEWKDGDVFSDDDYSRVYLETKEQFETVRKSDVIDIIRTCSARYNPIKQFIEDNRHLITNGKTNGLMKTLAESIMSDTAMREDCFDAEYEQYFITKWFVGMIATIYGNVSPLLLALTGKADRGKTEWFRRLLPEKLKKNYYSEIKLSTDKDAFAAMTKNILIMDDELSGKTKMEEHHLKELTSKAVFTYRPPYGVTHVRRRRLAVLAGTTNDEKVLSDPTGNRRIIPINVLEINREIYNSIDKDALFMEAVRLYESGEKWDLSRADIERLEGVTVMHKSDNFERELISLWFEKPETDAQRTFAKFMMTTEVLLELEKKTTQRLNIKKIGMEIRMMGFERIMKKVNGFPRYGYLILEKSPV